MGFPRKAHYLLCAWQLALECRHPAAESARQTGAAAAAARPPAEVARQLAHAQPWPVEAPPPWRPSAADLALLHRAPGWRSPRT